MQSNKKRGKRVQEKGTIMIFLSNFSKSSVFGMLSPLLNGMWFWRLQEKNKVFYFSKRALPVDTTRNKWLKKALFFKLILISVSPDNSSIIIETRERKLISFFFFRFRRGNPVFCPLDRTKVDDLRLVWFS